MSKPEKWKTSAGNDLKSALNKAVVLKAVCDCGKDWYIQTNGKESRGQKKTLPYTAK